MDDNIILEGTVVILVPPEEDDIHLLVLEMHIVEHLKDVALSGFGGHVIEIESLGLLVPDPEIIGESGV